MKMSADYHKKVGKAMRKMGFKAQWRPLTPRSSKDGKSFTSKDEATARAKRYRKEFPKKMFKIQPNWNKTAYAVSIRDWTR
tara:strand:- start:836 stop:1078 length:243 start_codon:yes stop_codon:yes gene_type:complete